MNQRECPSIGTLRPAHPFFLAPLAGITDSPFRRLCREQGASLVYSEMVSAKGLYYSDKATAPLLRFSPEEAPIFFQLFGSDPGIMAWAVERLAGRDNAGWDINMGCPVPKVVKNGEGAALMKDPPLAASIVSAMVRAERESALRLERPEKPVTVKCRIGWDRSSVNIRSFAQRMEEAGAAALAVHGRTREEFYSGEADWETIREVADLLSIPVIGSGDVMSGHDANRLLTETGCAYVMAARGALGNPWIFREAVALWEGRSAPPPPTPQEKLDVFLRQLDMTVAEKGEYAAVREMRKHAGWYLKGLPGAAALRQEVNRLATADALRMALERDLGHCDTLTFRHS